MSKATSNLSSVPMFIYLSESGQVRIETRHHRYSMTLDEFIDRFPKQSLKPQSEPAKSVKRFIPQIQP